jgi:hypothetical protein
MAEGFDFGFTPQGEIIIDNNSHDIQKSEADYLRIQLAYNRIKSISHNWFIDEVGANLEEIIGKACTKETAEYGKLKIEEVLIFDGLWDKNDIFIKSEIKNNTNISYNIYLKLYNQDTNDIYSCEIVAELDLIKGVNIRYGWEPRR